MQQKTVVAPPAYETVDVIHEFGLAFKKRQESVYTKFATQRRNLRDEYEFQLEELNKEEQTELQVLTSLYSNWIKNQPELSKPSTTLSHKSYWQWLWG